MVGLGCVMVISGSNWRTTISGSGCSTVTRGCVWRTAISGCDCSTVISGAGWVTEMRGAAARTLTLASGCVTSTRCCGAWTLTLAAGWRTSISGARVADVDLGRRLLHADVGRLLGDGDLRGLRGDRDLRALGRAQHRGEHLVGALDRGRVGRALDDDVRCRRDRSAPRRRTATQSSSVSPAAATRSASTGAKADSMAAKLSSARTVSRNASTSCAQVRSVPCAWACAGAARTSAVDANKVVRRMFMAITPVTFASPRGPETSPPGPED